jgi:hypothetical protein
MASRKQRRRREKEKRHDYEIVEIDSEGNETILDSSVLKPESSRNGKASPSRKARGGQPDRGRRIVQEPSWGRVMKRGLMFAPIFFVVVYLLAGDGMTVVGLIVQTLLLLVVFVPFSYFMDRLVWRSQQRRLAKSRDGS